MRERLDAQQDLCCVGVAHSVQGARSIAGAVPFDAAVVDLGLPDGDGTTVVSELRRIAPRAHIVVLTAHPRSDLARRALGGGADRVLPKRGTFSDVLAALRDRAFPASPHGRADEVILTPREREVLALLATGTDVRGAANVMGLSEFTVRDHVKSLLAKLGARSQLEAVITATRVGILLLEPE